MRLAVTFDQLLPGDKLIAVGEWPFRESPEVAARPEGDRVALVNPRGTGAEHNLYRDFGDDYTIERAVEPGPPVAVDPTEDVLIALARANPRQSVAATREHGPWGTPGPSKWIPKAPGGREHGDPQPGSVVLFPIRNFWQAGVVLKAGPKRVHIVYVTLTGIAKRKAGLWFTDLRTEAPRGNVYVVGGEHWVGLALRELAPKAQQ